MDDVWQHTARLLIVWATASLAVVVLMIAGQLPGWSHWVFVLLQVPCACYMADRVWWHFKGAQTDG